MNISLFIILNENNDFICKLSNKSHAINKMKFSFKLINTNGTHLFPKNQIKKANINIS
jgi:hypothetical protein